MTALFPLIMAAVFFIWLKYKVIDPLFFRPQKPKITQPAPKITPPEPDKREVFLRHMLEAERTKLEGLEQLIGPEPAEMIDEAAHLPPLQPENTKRDGGTPRTSLKPKTARLPVKPKLHAGQRLSTLAAGIRIPAQFEYLGGSTPGRSRTVLIQSACGYVEEDGSFNVTIFRCICSEAEDWRAFRIDRIRDFVELQHGEAIADPKAWITQKLNTWV